MISIEKIMRLTRHLYPTGRAFRIPHFGELEKMHEAFAESEKKTYDDATSILYSILPDNANFTSLDAEQWENRLGIISNPSVNLEDRKLAIIRKLNHPGDIKARQSWDYLTNSLQLAGFNVFVKENIPQQSIENALQNIGVFGQQGDGQQGDFQQGSAYSYYSDLFLYPQQGNFQQGNIQQGELLYKNKVANYIIPTLDEMFNFNGNYRSIFFVGGYEIGQFANVDINRKNEFRQLILKLKPAHSIAVLFIKYI